MTKEPYQLQIAPLDLLLAQETVQDPNSQEQGLWNKLHKFHASTSKILSK